MNSNHIQNIRQIVQMRIILNEMDKHLWKLEKDIKLVIK